MRRTPWSSTLQRCLLFRMECSLLLKFTMASFTRHGQLELFKQLIYVSMKPRIALELAPHLNKKQRLYWSSLQQSLNLKLMSHRARLFLEILQLKTRWLLRLLLKLRCQTPILGPLELEFQNGIVLNLLLNICTQMMLKTCAHPLASELSQVEWLVTHCWSNMIRWQQSVLKTL